MIRASPLTLTLTNQRAPHGIFTYTIPSLLFSFCIISGSRFPFSSPSHYLPRFTCYIHPFIHTYRTREPWYDTYVFHSPNLLSPKTNT
ncbi:hypothetical protein BDN67DRAFT_174757 [Paxillus ammoniavirescens]|nr:hypothetical protein BDN67DRAFT_174757 [Paxillus ammoniavirescens]